jgi:hypothetical protein
MRGRHRVGQRPTRRLRVPVPSLPLLPSFVARRERKIDNEKNASSAPENRNSRCDSVVAVSASLAAWVLRDSFPVVSASEFWAVQVTWRRKENRHLSQDLSLLWRRTRPEMAPSAAIRWSRTCQRKD